MVNFAKSEFINNNYEKFLIILNLQLIIDSTIYKYL